MTVFALYGNYYDPCSGTEALLGLYACQDDALEDKSVLESHKYDERDSYFIRELEVQ